jgi:hypothetical protein
MLPLIVNTNNQAKKNPFLFSPSMEERRNGHRCPRFSSAAVAQHAQAAIGLRDQE